MKNNFDKSWDTGSKILVAPSPPVSRPSYKCHHGLRDSSPSSPGDEHAAGGGGSKEAGPEKEMKWSNTQHVLTAQLRVARGKGSTGTAGDTAQRCRRRSRRTKRGRQVAGRGSPAPTPAPPMSPAPGGWGLRTAPEGFPPAEINPISPHAATKRSPGPGMSPAGLGQVPPAGPAAHRGGAPRGAPGPVGAPPAPRVPGPGRT